MKYDTIYDKDILNIFTDASMYSGTFNGYAIGCAGVELATSTLRRDVTQNLYPGMYIPSYVITLDTTNNNSELIAIRQGILFALANKDRFSEINLFSDSQISVNALNEWVFGWYYKSAKRRDYIFTNSKDEPVANQELIKNIMCLIYCNNLHIRIYHQRGHMVGNTRDVKRDFIKANRIKEFVSNAFIEEICGINDIVDKRSRHTMKTFVETGYAPHIVDNTKTPGLLTDIKNFDMRYYRELIRR